ncbi:MAG: hypothetical protein R2883_00595 [Caldisericia bacterium]
MIFFGIWNGTFFETPARKTDTKDLDSYIPCKYEIKSHEFELDSNDIPHLVWGQATQAVYDEKSELGSYCIRYLRWDGKNWVTADGKRYLR